MTEAKRGSRRNALDLSKLMVACLIAVAPSYQALGQAAVATPIREQTVQAPDDSVVCMARPLPAIAQVLAPQQGMPLYVAIAAANSKQLKNAGFSEVGCDVAGLASPEQLGEWRAKVCGYADFGNEAVQNQYARAFGISPRALCSAARAPLSEAADIE